LHTSIGTGKKALMRPSFAFACTRFVRAARPPRVAAGATLAALVLLVPASFGACIPHPTGDFDDYTARTEGYGTPTGDGGAFDGAPPTAEVDGLFYGACLSQLAFNRVDRVFNFYTKTKYIPDAAGGTGKLTLSLQAMAVDPATNGPPKTFAKTGTSGGEMLSPTPAVVGADGKYTLELGLVAVPGNANPITGRDVEIINTKLVGRFAEQQFCARLNGTVVKPTNIPLEPEKNVCQFVLVKDGDPTPIFASSDAFTPSTCPD